MAENLKLAKALREAKSFFQGASNAAASNVSAPVDAIAWALRKAGVPVGDTPMGGSDWMRQKGLTAEAPGASGLIGESVGNVAPIVASAKAAQIAKGLLQAGENLAAPATMNPQAGAIVFHGSPHKFEAFDASKIGTGEGAQAYGHGLYFAESPQVAQGYQRDISRAQQLAGKSEAQDNIAGKPISVFYEQLQRKADRLPPALAGVEYEKLAFLEDLMQQPSFSDAVKRIDNEAIVPWAKALESKYQPAGSLYKVDLPDEAIAKMLDYDKPIGSGPIADAIAPIYRQQLLQLSGGQDVPLNVAREMAASISGQRAYQMLGAPQDAATTLRQAGIPGIRYLDQGSRGAGQGSSNYVVFPGNESLLTILERNGQLLGTK